MKERIILSPDTYIEYERGQDAGEITITSLSIVHKNKTDSKLNNPYFTGILACLIEQHLMDSSRCEEDIVRRAWPQNAKLSAGFEFERNLSEQVRKLRNALSKIIGDDAAKNLLPNKQRFGDYRICYPESYVVTNQPQLVQSNQSRLSSIGEIAFMTLFDLHTTTGLSNIEIAKQLVKNDVDLYGYAENTPQEGSAVKWASFMDEEPEGWGFLVRNNSEIIGNFSAVCLSDEQRTLLLDGKLFDGEVSLDDTKAFKKGYNNTLYILNISINTEFNSIENRCLLYDSFFELIISLAKNHGIFFKEIYTTSWKFRKILSSYGFSNIKTKEDGSVILGIRHFPSDLLWDRANEITEIYCNSSSAKEHY